MDIKSKVVNCPSLNRFISMAGFFSEKRYVVIADNILVMIMILGCSILHVFQDSLFGYDCCFQSSVFLLQCKSFVKIIGYIIFTFCFAGIHI